MKKNFFVKGLAFLSAVCLSSSFIFIAPINNTLFVSAASITVNNGSFETEDGNSKPVDWTVLSDVDSMDGNLVSTDRAYTGNRSLKITDTSSMLASGVRSEDINATAGNFYESNVYCFLSSGTVTYLMEYWNSSSTRISAEAINLSTTGSWQQLKVAGTAPEGTVSITLLCYSNMANTGTSYFDLVTLNDNGKLLPNGNMETSYANGQPTEWEFDMTDCTDNAYKSTAVKHNGIYSLCLDDTSGSLGIAVRSSFFKATAGLSYTANAYLYPDQGDRLYSCGILGLK